LAIEERNEKKRKEKKKKIVGAYERRSSRQLGKRETQRGSKEEKTTDWHFAQTKRL